jgi:predicted nucleotidyltransferase
MNIIYEVLSGSHAYGLATETSDEDIRGIFLPTAEELLGFSYPETKEGKPDKVYHCLRKYMHLALKANPSILAWLWVEPRFIRVGSWISYELTANRERFLSKEVHKTFGGYAVSQLRKMEKSYGLGTGYALHGERNAEADVYSTKAHYDTKNSMHLIRLLRCGVELLQVGRYFVYRDDADLLMAIRHGEYKMNEIISMADDLFKAMDKALETTNLPDKPDREWAEQFLCKAHLWAIEHGG